MGREDRDWVRAREMKRGPWVLGGRVVAALAQVGSWEGQGVIRWKTDHRG